MYLNSGVNFSMLGKFQRGTNFEIISLKYLISLDFFYLNILILELFFQYHYKSLRN